MDSHNICTRSPACRTDKASPRGTTNLELLQPKVDALADKIERETTRRPAI